MNVLRALRSMLDFFGPGNIVLGIVLLIATPYVDRFLIRRKRISYRVLYNSKIGLGPERLLHDDESADPGVSQLRQVTELLNRMSIVVIRIRNSGSYDIGADDFDPPLSFTFGQRIVWNARVSDATSEQTRTQIRSGLRFFRTASVAADPAERDSLRTVRERLATRISRWVGGPAGQDVAETPEVDPQWHGVRLDQLALRRRQKFKLVVVLREPDDSGEDITKEIEQLGDLKDTGLIKDEKRRQLVTLPRVTGALAVLLTMLLVLSITFTPEHTDPNLACGSGDLRIEGSSVFMPAMTAIAQEYTRVCGGARITTQATGSIAGVRAVAAADGDRLAALSDGKQVLGQGGLYAQQLAIVVYHVVVNGSVGLDSLTTAQLRGIYDGTYQDWSQLRGGAPLPIRIVGRGSESGTRELFESKVLGTGESVLSSNECLAKDRNPKAPAIRCERDSNAEVVRMISQTPGSIGYADAPSVAEARKSNALTALSLDGKVFDASVGVESGYPFWTVEYLYTRTRPQPGTLVDRFVEYVQKHDSARVRLKDAGYLPCTTAEGSPLELCNHR